MRRVYKRDGITMLIDSCMNCPWVRVEYKTSMVSGRKMTAPKRAYCRKLAQNVTMSGLEAKCPMPSDEIE